MFFVFDDEINTEPDFEQDSHQEEEVNIEKIKEVFQLMQKEIESLKKINNELTSKVVHLESTLSEKEKSLNEIQSYAKNTIIEMEKMNERHEKAINDQKEYAISKLAKDILSVIDSFEKAIDSMTLASHNADGVEVIMKEMLSILKSNKILPIESDGLEFDPSLHMAVSNESDESLSNNIVIRTLRKGYTIGDRCLREALVIVNTI